MQLVSKEYKEAMQLPFRNRAYIRVSIGVVNSDAQNNAVLDDDTELTYYSDGKSRLTDIRSRNHMLRQSRTSQR